MDSNALALNRRALEGDGVIDMVAGQILQPCKATIARVRRQLAVGFTVSTLDQISASELLLDMRQIDMRLLPMGELVSSAGTPTSGIAAPAGDR